MFINLIKKLSSILRSFQIWMDTIFPPAKENKIPVLKFQEARSKFTSITMNTKQTLLNSLLEDNSKCLDYYKIKYDKIVDEYLNKFNDYQTGMPIETYNRIYTDFVFEVNSIFQVRNAG